MNHNAVRRRLSAYMEERLSARAHAQLEAHLDACPACREELYALERTVQLLRGLDAEEPPANLAAQVFERIEAGEGSTRFSSRWNGAWAAPLATALAGLALVVAVQSVEIEVGWPSATPAQGVRAEAAPAPSPAAAEQPAPSFTARTSAPAPTALPAAGVSLRTRCLRQPGSAACAAWHAWLLGLAVDEPRAFVMEVDAVPDSARRRWLGDLSRFAANSGSAPRVAERLRQAEDPRAQSLAPHFERVSSLSPR